MIIKDATKRKRNTVLAYILLGLLGCCSLILLLLISSNKNKPNSDIATHGAIWCSAETVKDSQFVNQQYKFGSAVYQSNLAARTGSYSCRLPASGETVYGFGYKFQSPPAGRSYKASVWRKKGLNTDSYLVVNLEGEHAEYLQVNQPTDSDTTGWERLEIRFNTPYQKSVERINVYVYSLGQNEAFFDDLLIEELFVDSSSVFTRTVIDLEVKGTQLEQLKQKRAEALQRGILTSAEDDWVKAKLKEGSQAALPIEIRLKGDWLDHLRGDKWSFRVKMREGNTWRRMRSFSLHTPLARNFLSEWVLHQLWEKEDVLTTRYDFIELRLNGQPLGVYAVEEHFDKQLVEYRQRREGPIIKLSETAYWAAIERQLQQHGFVATVEKLPPAEWQKAPIEAFRENTINENPVLAEQYEQARSLLYQYQQGWKPASDIFDIERMAKYYAISDILNAYHGIVWHNQRFYYNPVTALLEPIGFDGFGGPPEQRYGILGAGALHPTLADRDQIFSSLMLDPLFTRAYIAALNRISDKEYLQPFLDKVYPGWAARLAFLQTEFTTYQPDLGEITTEAQYIQSILLPIDNFSLTPYQKGNKLLLENRHILPIEVVGYGLRPDQMTEQLDTALVLPGAIGRKFLQRIQRDSQITDFKKLKFLEHGVLKEQSPPLFFSLEINAQPSYLFFRVLGTERRFSSKVNKQGIPDYQIASQALKKGAKVRKGASYQVKGENIYFKAGKHVLSEDIVLPAGYTIVLEAGTTIELEAGVHFISFSPVKAYGTPEQPINIQSKEGAGRGFTVLNAAGRSDLKHVYFEGLGAPDKDGWKLTGAVTFYESAVHLSHCSFTHNQSEDALNIIRSTFKMAHCHISHTFSDGFDADFCKGEIDNSFFIRTGNDGLDCSGSIVNVSNCTFENNGDKGISVGEQSDLTVFDCRIKGAPIALASKDLSVVYVRNLYIENCQQGFAAYQKKPEFGGANIIVESYKAKEVKRLYAIGAGSKLQLEGEVIEN
jgi:hypothetical protein